MKLLLNLENNISFRFLVLIVVFLQILIISFFIHTFHIEKKHVRTILICNKFTNYLFGPKVNTFLNWLSVPERVNVDATKMDIIVLLYLGQFSVNMIPYLYNYFWKSLVECNLKLVSFSRNRLNNLFHFKGTTPFWSKFNDLRFLESWL